jgi:broad specificity phosphatase PhoE
MTAQAMPTRLVLIAHAPTAANRRAAFAADEGIEPLRTAPARAERFDRCFVAPERRARETAAALGWTAEVDKSLSDLDAGAWRGRSFDELLAEAPEALAAWTSDPTFRPPHGDSVEDLIKRMAMWTEAQRRQGGRIGAVAHPAVLRAAAIAALGAPPALFWQLDAGPLTRLELRSDGRRWTLRGLAAVNRDIL